MKAQFATIESIISLMIVISSLSLYARTLPSMQEYLIHAGQNASRAAASYDFINQILENTSTYNCVTSQNPSYCMQNYSKYYKEIYGIRSIGIMTGPNQSGAYLKTYCGTISGNYLCVGVS